MNTDGCYKNRLKKIIKNKSSIGIIYLALKTDYAYNSPHHHPFANWKYNHTKIDVDG